MTRPGRIARVSAAAALGLVLALSAGGPATALEPSPEPGPGASIPLVVDVPERPAVPETVPHPAPVDIGLSRPGTDRPDGALATTGAPPITTPLLVALAMIGLGGAVVAARLRGSRHALGMRSPGQVFPSP